MRIEESRDDPGKIDLFIDGNYARDATVSLEELIELRCEIDKYLLLSLARSAGGSTK